MIRDAIKRSIVVGFASGLGFVGWDTPRYLHRESANLVGVFVTTLLLMAGCGWLAWKFPFRTVYGIGTVIAVATADVVICGWLACAYRSEIWLEPAIIGGVMLAIPSLIVAEASRGSRLRYRPPSAHGSCAKCGYDLTGNATGRCPECGQSAADPDHITGDVANTHEAGHPH